MHSPGGRMTEDLTQLPVEAWCPDGTVGMALRGGEVIFLQISSDQLEQDNLAALAGKLVALHDKVLREFRERALELLPSPSRSAREQELWNAISEYADTHPAAAPRAPAPEPPPANATAIEETGFTLWYRNAVLAAIEFDESAWRLSPQELETSLRAAFNRGFQLAGRLELSPPELPTVDDLEELVNRIQDLRKGIYR